VPGLRRRIAKLLAKLDVDECTNFITSAGYAPV
jgi:hypothetical protein